MSQTPLCTSAKVAPQRVAQSVDDPLLEGDAEACALARSLLKEVRFAAIGTLDTDGFPHVSRIAFGRGPRGGYWSLISRLALHAKALRRDPRAGLMVGLPGPKGDPLTHPRLSLRVEAHAIDPMNPLHPTLCDRWLADHPKSKLYITLPDFYFVEFKILAATLNGGFARAWRLRPEDLD